MDVTVTSVAALWAPVLILVAAFLLLGTRRDRGRPSRGRVHTSLVAAVVGSVVVLATAAAVTGWVGYRQQRAEDASCSVPGEC